MLTWLAILGMIISVLGGDWLSALVFLGLIPVTLANPI